MGNTFRAHNFYTTNFSDVSEPKTGNARRCGDTRVTHKRSLHKRPHG